MKFSLPVSSRLFPVCHHFCKKKQQKMGQNQSGLDQTEPLSQPEIVVSNPCNPSATPSATDGGGAGASKGVWTKFSGLVGSSSATTGASPHSGSNRPTSPHHGDGDSESGEEASDTRGLLSRFSNPFAGLRGNASASNSGPISSLFQPEESMLTRCLPDLSFTERLVGFAMCCSIGLLFSLMAWMSVFNWVRFGVCFTLGNIFSLASSTLLVGPATTLKSAMSEEHRLCTIIYLASLIGTLVCAFWLQSGVLVLLMCIAQYSAFIWYCLSYIPGGQSAAKKFFGWAFHSCFK